MRSKFLFQNIIKYEKYLFFLLLLLYLLPIWKNKYFLTGDGPLHLYNSKVLLDLAKGNHTAFYNKYYELNTNPEPNWTNHAILMVLMTVFSPIIAEKIFITLYVILFMLGARLLIKKINPNGIIFSYIIFPFVYHHPFHMGFYNNSLSIALMFFVIYFYLKNAENFKKKQAFFLMLSLTLLFFTHPIGYALSLITIALFFLFNFFKSNKIKKEAFPVFFREAFPLIIAILPSIILSLYFILNKGGINATQNPDSYSKLYSNLTNLTSLIAVSSDEINISKYFSIFIWSLFIIILFIKILSRQISISDVWFLLFLLTLLIYFNQPGGAAGAGIVSVRLQYLPYLFMIFWMSSIKTPAILRLSILGLGIFFLTAFIYIRMPHYQKISDGVEEYLYVTKYINDFSVVLPVNYAPNGKDTKGDKIADRIWLFYHLPNYVGTEKALIMLGNSEANTNWFPLLWKEGQSPFVLLAYNEEGIFGIPPHLNIDRYNSNNKIDYILIYGLDEELEDHEYTDHLIKNLEKKYSYVGSSPNKLVKVFKLKESDNKPSESIKNILIPNRFKTIKSLSILPDSIKENETTETKRLYKFNSLYSTTFVSKLDTFPILNDYWIRANCKIKTPFKLNPYSTALIISFEDNNGSYHFTSTSLSNVGREWESYTIKTPLIKAKSANDIIKVYIWNKEEKEFWIEDFNIELIKKIN